MVVAFEEDIPQVRSDWFIYVVLRCLPYVGQELSEADKPTLDNIVDQIGEYIKNRNKKFVELLQVWSASPHDQEEYLDCLWAQICKLREDGWKEKHLSHHCVAFDGVLADALEHNITNFVAPPHTDDKLYPLPKVIFRLFDYADCPEEGPVLPGVHSIERFLIEEDLGWIIEQNVWNRKDCATELLDYQRRHKVPINYMSLEVIFSQLFRLPTAPTKPLFYGSLLIEMCRMQPTSMPQVIAQATELLYQRLDSMNFTAIDHLIDWFSYHMSNFEYRWLWTEWSDCLELDPLSPKTFFIRESLQKCMHLSYHQRIEACLPGTFRKVMPTMPFITYEYEDEGAPTLDLAQKIGDLMKSKTTAGDMLEILKGDDMEGESEDKIVGTFMGVLLNLSRATVSHSFAALTRYYNTLKQLAAGEETQMTVLRAVYSVWKHNEQMMGIITNKIVTMTIVDANAVVAWLFTDQMKPELERLWTWNVLCDVVEHVSGHLKRCRKKLESLRKAQLFKFKKDEDEDGTIDEDSDSDSDSNVDDIHTLETEVEDVRDFVQNLLLDVLHKLTVKLTEHIVACETKEEDVNTPAFRYFTARFRGVFLKNWKELFECSGVLEKTLFIPNTLDAQVMESFSMFISMKS